MTICPLVRLNVSKHVSSWAARNFSRILATTDTTDLGWII